MRLPARLLIVLCLTAPGGRAAFLQARRLAVRRRRDPNDGGTGVLVRRFRAAYDSPTYRLPHMIPLSYSLIHWSCARAGKTSLAAECSGPFSAR